MPTMYFESCNETFTINHVTYPCFESNGTLLEINDNWPMERVVSMVVPVIFGIIGLLGFVGNVLVIVGK